MTAAEHHQQQLEHQQYVEELLSLRHADNLNHGKMIGAVRFLRDAVTEGQQQIAIKSLLDALEEHEQIVNKMRSL